MAIPILPSRSDGLPGIQVAVDVRVRLVDGVHLPVQEATIIKSPSLFQVENNKISRDVKSLFLGVRFISSRIISVIIRLQLEDELHVQMWCSVRGVKGLLGLSPLGLISHLLRGQVNLSI